MREMMIHQRVEYCAVYMTTTKANLVWEEEHTHARQA